MRLINAYKRTRLHNQEGNLEDKERKRSFVVLRKMKRASSLKEPSRSTWEDLCCLEVDLVDKVGKNSLGTNLGKFGNTGLLEACVRHNQNL
jgi:hypothetical protein